MSQGKWNQEIVEAFLSNTYKDYQAIPSYTKSWVDDPMKIFIEKLVEFGKIAIACANAGIGEATCYAWKSETSEAYHKEFQEVIKKARAIWAQNRITALQSKGFESWQSEAWLLERIMPDEFKETIATEDSTKSTDTLTQILQKVSGTTKQPEDNPAHE